MGLDVFRVSFERPNGVYFAGETVQGSVNVRISGNPKKTRGRHREYVY